jgi:sarcosine oxidase, subunit delta
MLLINCPYCGERPEPEFIYGGQAHVARPGTEATNAQWTRFLYERDNDRGAHAERWRHFHGCGCFFNAVRDTTTDRFLATYRVGEPRPKVTA